MRNIADKFLQIIAFIDAKSTPQQWAEMESDLDEIYHLLQYDQNQKTEKKQVLSFSEDTSISTCQYEDYDFSKGKK
tara:strand:+ start:303 stop:530 length:228 start_codon:yes stop_codon:yes gene_type:complete